MSHSMYQWLSLVGIIWLQSFNGTNTDFPAYSSQLKKLLSISQFQLNNLAFASDAGKLLGWFSGVAANYLPLWVVLILGATLGLIGYGVQFLYVANKIWDLSIIKNFPFDPQVSVGLATSYVGLSAKIYTDIVDVLSSSSSDATSRAKNYLLLNSILPLIVSLVTTPMLLEDVSKKDTKADKAVQSGFTVMFFVTIVSGIYSVIGTLLLILIPLMIPLGLRVGRFMLNCWQTKRDNKICNLSMDGDHVSANSNDEVVMEMKELAEVVDQDSSISVTDSDDSIGSCTSSCREEIGVKMMVAESRGQSSATTSSLVSLSSAFCFFGRLLPSLLHHFSISLYISTVIIGLCIGSFTSISVSATTELFERKNFSINHNIVVGNIPIGSFVFGTAECYNTTFIIWGCISLLGTVLAFVLHLRTRKFYKQKQLIKMS
ncbi:hypothetical protein MKW94_019712 [Papaver nudicaule]|uniref:Nodulin-like domain-containing protein n=1 Tax=Papaver nudicaule TaxID=74823 RepID=A0AA42B426_PAPNU|nr:hypothetical protein [Papaver nudicaule]